MLLACLVSACGTIQQDFPQQVSSQQESFAQASSQWQSQLELDHPLVGRIWNSRTGNFVQSETLIADLERARYILLGEKHDNPDHHALQLEVLNQLLARELVAQVSFEMLDSDSQARLDELSHSMPLSLSELNTAIAWDNEGWDWDFYGPLVQAAHQAGTRLNAANINRETMSQVYAEPLQPEIDSVLTSETMNQLEVDIDESHCGMLPESQFPAMVRVQQARDYAMAESLLFDEPYKLAVLIAGNYHIRQDLGVPNYLMASESSVPRDQVLALSFMEVQNGEEDPSAYLQQYSSQPAFDYIWFTPAVSNEDYCASLRQ